MDSQRHAFLLLLLMGFLCISTIARSADSPVKQLYEAIDAGKVSEVEALLKQGVEVDSRGALGMTPLIGAASIGNAELMRVILSHKPNLYAEDNFGQTALTHVARKEALLGLLLDAGWDVNRIDSKGRTALLQIADEANAKVVQALLDAGASLNIVDTKGRNAAWLAMSNQRHGVEVLERLIEAGINLRLVNLDGASMLSEAAYWGNAKVFKLLLGKGLDPWAVDSSGNSALVIAMGGGGETRQQIADWLLERDPPQEQLVLALNRAIDTQEYWMVSKLLEAGAPKGGAEQMGKALKSGSPKTVKALLQGGWDLSVASQEQVSEWLRMAIAGDRDKGRMVRLLIGQGVKLRLDEDGFQEQVESGYFEPLKYLIANGASLPEAVGGRPVKTYLDEIGEQNLLAFIEDKDAHSRYRVALPGQDPYQGRDAEFVGTWQWDGIAEVTLVLSADGRLLESMELFGAKKRKYGTWKRQAATLIMQFDKGGNREWAITQFSKNLMVLSPDDQEREYRRVSETAEIKQPEKPKPARLGKVGDTLTEAQAVDFMIQSACIKARYKEDQAAQEKAVEAYLEGSGIKNPQELKNKLKPYSANKEFQGKHIFSIMQGVAKCAAEQAE